MQMTLMQLLSKLTQLAGVMLMRVHGVQYLLDGLLYYRDRVHTQARVNRWYCHRGMVLPSMCTFSYARVNCLLLLLCNS